MKTLALALSVSATVFCIAPHLWSEEQRQFLGQIEIGPIEEFEFLAEQLEYRGDDDWTQKAYLEVIDFGDCPLDREFATEFVSRVVIEEEQDHSVHIYEVGCLTKPNGHRVVTVLQTNRGTNVFHKIFVYDLNSPFEVHTAIKRCDFGYFSYDAADVELTGSGNEEGFIVVTSSASTGVGIASVFDPSCSRVFESTSIRNRVIQDANSRALVTVEPITRERNECGFLVRRLGVSNEIVARESCSECRPNYESAGLMSQESVEAMRRMLSRFHYIDFSTPPLADEPQ